MDDICPICGLELETLEHMFFKCPRSIYVWKMSLIRWPNLHLISDLLHGGIN